MLSLSYDEELSGHIRVVRFRFIVNLNPQSNLLHIFKQWKITLFTCSVEQSSHELYISSQNPSWPFNMPRSSPSLRL